MYKYIRTPQKLLFMLSFFKASWQPHSVLGKFIRVYTILLYLLLYLYYITLLILPWITQNIKNIV